MITRHPVFPSLPTAIVTIALALVVALSSPWTAAHAQTQPAPPPPANTTQPPQTPAPPKDQPPPLAPAESSLPEITKEQTRISAAIEKSEAAIDRARDDEDRLETIRTEIEKILSEQEDLKERASPQVASIASQLAKLGKPPEASADPEPEDITRERARLRELATKYGAIVKSIDLAETRGEQLVARIKALRQAIFARNLLQHDPSPFGFTLWRDVAKDLPQTLEQLSAIAEDWQETVLNRWRQALSIIPLVLIAGLALFLFRRRTMRSIRPPLPDQPPFYRRALAAFAATPVLAMTPVITLVIIQVAIEALELVPSYLVNLFRTAMAAAIIFFVIRGAIKAGLPRRRDTWRLVDLPGLTAGQLAFLMQGALLAYGIDFVFAELVQTLYVAPAIAIIFRFIANIVAATLLMAIVLLPFTTRAQSLEDAKLMAPYWLKLPLLAAALLIIVASCTGYMAFGHFILGQLLLAAAMAAFAATVHVAVRSYVATLREADIVQVEETTGTDSATTAQPVNSRRRILSDILMTSLDGLLLLVAIPVLMLTWGFSTNDIQAGAKAAIFGFQLGDFRISIARIAIAVGLFAGVIILTRFAQRTVRRWLDSMAPSDKGVTNSIQAFIGYAGIAIAVLSGLSYAGFDVTNVAIVAGALSVGIGFGLQSIVNNFVSGLILLFERPVKVGDWVVVNGNEGTIRKISVRATEIETFDRASIIVPNSEFITAAVTNWTHRNALGRVVIKIGVSYDADPEKVKTILLAVAQRSKLVLSHPAPFVVFEDFGPSSLDFSLRVYLADVTKRLSALTDLRMDIFKALKEASISIPFPQTDVHIRDLDPIREALAAAARARAPAVEPNGST